MSAGRILLLPTKQKGQGTGHSRRCRSLEMELKNLVPDVQLPDEPHPDGRLVVVDRRQTGTAELNRLAENSTPVLIDDDGPARQFAPYLIDIIPGPRSTAANISNPLFMDLPVETRKPDASQNILVSFGGEDPGALTVAVLKGIAGLPGNRSVSCTVPSELSPAEVPAGVSILDAPENLRNLLGTFGLVICSYGLTTWEALAAGCAVLTVDPSPYHAMLSMNAGFPGLGFVNTHQSNLKATDLQKLDVLLRKPLELNLAATKAKKTWLESPPVSSGNNNPAGIAGLAALLSSMDAPVPVCAACGEKLPPVLVRFSRRSYYHCPSCHIIGLYRFQRRQDEYSAAYFQQEYEEQYGRTYLEDFENIKAMGKLRLAEIGRKAKKGGSLLDIGCAFGPFLAAADEAGYIPFGSDVSAEGTTYVRDVLRFPAIQGRFPEDNPALAHRQDGYDVVSLWYVIEHFENLREVLVALNGQVNSGGVLALSTPNGAGISGRVSLRKFLKNSPEDHYTIWNPKNARRILARYGFRVFSIRVTGHHPERFPGKPAPGSIRFGLFGIISRVFGLGDTFEVYAVKERSVGH